MAIENSALTREVVDWGVVSSLVLMRAIASGAASARIHAAIPIAMASLVTA